MRRFLLLSLLGFFAWCTVPTVLRARTSSRQKQTMADMRSIAVAWEARATEINSYSVGARNHRITTDDLARALEPKYIRRLPRKDAWGTDFQFSTTDYDADGSAGTYIIRSLGSDRRADAVSNVAGGPTSNPADDLVYSNGSFIRYPVSAG